MRIMGISWKYEEDGSASGVKKDTKNQISKRQMKYLRILKDIEIWDV